MTGRWRPLDLRATQYALLREIERHELVALHPLAEAMVMDRATLVTLSAPWKRAG